MFEQSPSQLPSSSIWASMSSWFTPAVFFVLLNVMIGTIAFTSTLSNKKQKQPPNQNHHQTEEIHDQPKPSVLQRLKSVNFYPHFFISQDPQNSSIYKQTPDSFNSHENLELQSNYFFQENLRVSQSQDTNYTFERTHEQNRQESQTHSASEQRNPDLGDSKGTQFDVEQKGPDSNGSKPTHLGFEQKDPVLDGFDQAQDEKIEENEAVEQSMDEVYSQLTGNHFIRTESDTEPTGGEMPVNLPARMRKSASMKSPFGHFEEEKVVEARRPATVRERRGNNGKAAEGDNGVDARADDFINKFKQQLKLQRLDSIIRYKDMIGRGGRGGKD